MEFSLITHFFTANVLAYKAEISCVYMAWKTCLSQLIQAAYTCSDITMERQCPNIMYTNALILFNNFFFWRLM